MAEQEQCKNKTIMTFLIIGIIIAICVGFGYEETDNGGNGSMPGKLGGDDKDF